MSMISFDIDIDLSKLEAKFSDAKLEAVQEHFTETAMVDTDEYTPKRTGTMAASAHLSSPSSFTYTPYYSTFVYNGTRYITPREWFEPSKAANLGEWREQIAGELIA